MRGKSLEEHERRPTEGKTERPLKRRGRWGSEGADTRANVERDSLEEGGASANGRGGREEGIAGDRRNDGR
jgi:hypothetical protein